MNPRKRHHRLAVETLDPRALPSSMFVGDTLLLPNLAKQEIWVVASGDTLIRGMNLRVQLGDGRGSLPEPSITNISFDDTIWSEYERIVEGGPVEDEPQFAQLAMVLAVRDISVTANGVLAKLEIDTTGFNSGTFDVRITDNLFGAPSDFAGVMPSPINNGTIKIASPGDANLDGAFNATDLISVFQAGEYQDSVGSNSTWAEGDWNQNGDFETSDLILAFQVGNYIRN